MDGQRFDDLVKQLCSKRLSRVNVLRGVAAGVLAAATGAKVSAAQVIQAPPCRDEGSNCEGGGQTCCAGLVCNGLENPTKCRVCGGSGQFCCTTDPACNTPGEICLPSGTCGPANTPPCGAANQICCPPNNACVAPLICQGGTCQPGAACGAQGQACCPGNLCSTGLTCSNGTCQPISGGGGGGGGGGAAFSCTSNAQCAALSSTAPFCNTSTGTCFGLQGLQCKSGELPAQCCNRSVKKGCNRKQQTAHARKNCLKKGKKRCKALLAGIV